MNATIVDERINETVCDDTLHLQLPIGCLLHVKLGKKTKGKGKMDGRQIMRTDIYRQIPTRNWYFSTVATSLRNLCTGCTEEGLSVFFFLSILFFFGIDHWLLLGVPATLFFWFEQWHFTETTLEVMTTLPAGKWFTPVGDNVVAF